MSISHTVHKLMPVLPETSTRLPASGPSKVHVVRMGFNMLKPARMGFHMIFYIAHTKAPLTGLNSEHESYGV
jgi:hypothetical protein